MLVVFDFGVWLRPCVSLGPNTYNENETIAKYEIMDGAPVRGKSAYLFLFWRAISIKRQKQIFDMQRNTVHHFAVLAISGKATAWGK